MNWMSVVEQFSTSLPLRKFYTLANRVPILGSALKNFSRSAIPSNVRRIREHASRNQLDAIQIIPKAVCSTVGRLRFQRASFQSSMNRGVLVEDAFTPEETTIEVESITLDAVAREQVLPTLIKVDVEGSEAAVLQGSEEIFRTAKPFLVCEIHHEQASSDVTGWLRARGYMFHWLESSTKFPRNLFAKYVGYPSDKSEIETFSSGSSGLE